MRINQSDLDSLFSALVAIAQRHTPGAANWVLYSGQSTYSIVTVDPITKGHSTVVSYIGTTKSEAYDYLTAMRTAYLLVG